MEWFHCNRCFRRNGTNFTISSCGHVCCEGCIKPTQCTICGANCKYLPITDEMKPQEKMFFMDPVKLIQSRLEQITQIALFQRKQNERVTSYFKHKSMELERRLKEVTEESYRNISKLRRENNELKRPLSQRRVSPGHWVTDGSQRMTLPVGVTSPVTPCSRIVSLPGSVDSQGRTRDRGPRPSFTTTSGSVTSISSHSSLHERGTRTPTTLSTPASRRLEHQSSNNFQFQFFRGSALH